ncbi:MAG: bifunctional adenosylcobinamide kinase/adenosylcobinamide-phosphate guanylyltransferase [Elusimicrobiota bacterium]|nr:bifunctional adenosylcobinamide kinase/adenosylcobinamide-phosphate guanylyltransferase [Elusimicrobiota bacterium]
MGKIIFILGGAKSGKSSFALKIARKQKNILFIATAQPTDLEMRERIKKHKKQRPKNWETLEIKNALLEIHEKKFNVAIFDCLTIFVSNCMLLGETERYIMEKVKDFLTKIANKNKMVIVVSNEVGCGIVPKNKVARKFRDILGNVNQTVSSLANKVYYMIAGIPVLIKKEGK